VKRPPGPAQRRVEEAAAETQQPNSAGLELPFALATAAASTRDAEEVPAETAEIQQPYAAEAPTAASNQAVAEIEMPSPAGKSGKRFGLGALAAATAQQNTALPIGDMD